MTKNLLFALFFSTFAHIYPANAVADETRPVESISSSAEICNAPPPDSFRVTSIGGSFISLAWKPAWEGASQILYVSKKEISGGWVSQQVIPNVIGSTYTVEGLDGGKEYRFRIATKCSTGEPSELTSFVDGIALIVELTLAGRTPKNPTPISCHGIEYLKYNWVGFMISGEGSSNLFEVEINGLNSLPFGYVKRVENHNPIVAADQGGIYPNDLFPVVDQVLVPFRALRVNGGEPEKVGLVDITVNTSNSSMIDLCNVTNMINEPWKNGYSFVALTAKETILIPPTNGPGFKGTTNGVDFIVQNPCKDDILLFVSKEVTYNQKVSIRLINANGHTIMQQKLEYLTPQISFPVEWLLPGIYYIQLEFDQQVQTLKVIKSN